MKVWMVFVRYERSCRFLDSQWAVEAQATKRLDELAESFRTFGCAGGTSGTGFYAYIGTGEVVDVALPGEAKQ